MNKAIALTHFHVAPLPVAEMARAALVSGCALALLFAGPVLPF